MKRDKATPAGATYVRKRREDEAEFGDGFLVVRVSLGKRRWLCIQAGGDHSIDKQHKWDHSQWEKA